MNDNESINQVCTTVSLLQITVKNNPYFIFNDDNVILQESSFLNPSDVTAGVKQRTLVD